MDRYRYYTALIKPHMLQDTLETWAASGARLHTLSTGMPGGEWLLIFEASS